jgi:hypothetical protein
VIVSIHGGGESYLAPRVRTRLFSLRGGRATLGTKVR